MADKDVPIKEQDDGSVLAKIEESAQEQFDDELKNSGGLDEEEAAKDSDEEEGEEPENLATVTDFEKYLRWNCEAKFVLQVNKFWAMKAVKNKKRECGLSIKCLQVYITKEAPATGMNTGERFKKRLFGGPGTKTVSAPTPTPTPSKQDRKSTRLNSSH